MRDASSKAPVFGIFGPGLAYSVVLTYVNIGAPPLIKVEEQGHGFGAPDLTYGDVLALFLVVSRSYPSIIEYCSRCCLQQMLLASASSSSPPLPPPSPPAPPPLFPHPSPKPSAFPSTSSASRSVANRSSQPGFKCRSHTERECIPARRRTLRYDVSTRFVSNCWSTVTML